MHIDGVQYPPSTDDIKQIPPVLKAGAAAASALAAKTKAEAAKKELVSLASFSGRLLFPRLNSDKSLSRVQPVATVSKGATPPPPSPPLPKPVALKPCLLCKRIEPKVLLGNCKQCSLAVHVCTSFSTSSTSRPQWTDISLYQLATVSPRTSLNKKSGFAICASWTMPTMW